MAGLFEELPIRPIPANQYGISVKQVTRGSLISFHYPVSLAQKPNPIHDPYPLVIVADVWPKYIRGINIHYLTFPALKSSLGLGGEGSNFSYARIRTDAYLARSFRMYVRAGIKTARKLDLPWLIELLGVARSFDPSELERLRQVIDSQIQERLQLKASEMNAYESYKRNMRKWYKEATQAALRGPMQGLGMPTTEVPYAEAPPTQAPPATGEVPPETM